MSRRNEDVKYLTFYEAIAKLQDARAFQTKAWPSLTEPNRPFEEWLVLTDVYLAKLKAVYAETPSYINDGNELNLVGLARIEKYAAIVANLMVWAVQSAKGTAKEESKPAWAVRDSGRIDEFVWEVFNTATGERDTVHKTEKEAQRRVIAIDFGCTPAGGCE